MWRRDLARLGHMVVIALVALACLACSDRPVPPAPTPLPSPEMRVLPTATPDLDTSGSPSLPPYPIGEPIVILILPSVGVYGEPASPTQPETRSYGPPTPRPGLPIDPVEARYGVIDFFGGVADGRPSSLGRIRYCDPDQGTGSQADEQYRANAEYELLEGMPDRLRPILRRIGWEGLTRFTDDQKLRIYREAKTLMAVDMKPDGDGYRFSLILFDADASATGSAALVQGHVTRHGDILVEDRTPMKPVRC